MAARPPSLIIVGGGLAGGMCLLALAKFRPDVAVTLVEPNKAIGGNHLWSFFDADLCAKGDALVAPLVAHRWPGYTVRFPAHSRRVAQGYNSIESERLNSAVRASLPPSAIIHATASALSPTSVMLDNGRTITADAVLDASGSTRAFKGLSCSWQKFVGELLEIPAGHGLIEPILMDATVSQAEGYRFVYCLPFSPTQLFVEDTYYSDTPDLAGRRVVARIGDFAALNGWQVTASSRREYGVLPVVTGGDFDRFWPASECVARAGVRAGLFHPLTSYSLPDAVRFALWLATEQMLDANLGLAARAYARARWKRGAFDRLLARMLMRASDPSDRYRVLQRFYRLPAPLIARFYSSQSTLTDRVRTLVGKPPVSIRRAVAALVDPR